MIRTCQFSRMLATITIVLALGGCNTTKLSTSDGLNHVSQEHPISQTKNSNKNEEESVQKGAKSELTSDTAIKKLMKTVFEK